MKKFLRFLGVSAILLLSVDGFRAQCVPNFTYTVGSGGVVTFSSTTAGTNSLTAYYWYLSSNTFSSGLNMTNVSATYTTNGNYVVSMWLSDTLTNGPCNGWFTDTIYVGTAGCNDNLVIGHQQQANGLVNFWTTLSTPQVFSSSSWSFGDGGTSTNINPSHTYSASGMYLVVVTTTVGACTYSASQNVSVTVATCSINAAFSYSTLTNGAVMFFSTTTGAGSGAKYYWFFGDGSNGTGATITHTYNMNSNYGVILQVTDSTNQFGCKDTVLHFVNVTNAPCTNNTSFTMSKDSILPLTWNAMPNYPGNVTAVSWSWGDGSSSTGFYPSHTYSASGFYTICVSTTLSCGSPTTICWAGNIYRPSSPNGGNGSMVTVNVLNPGSTVGLKQNSLADSKINSYPSPVTDFLTIDGLANNSTASIRILDAVGREIRTLTVNAGDTGKGTIDVSSLSSGIYYLQVENNGVIETSKLIKQ